jgi:peptide-methionine (S)-S-oxide reductase
MSHIKFLFFISFCFLFGCNQNGNSQNYKPIHFTVEELQLLDTATFAAGCFWCVEAVYEQVKGVKDVVAGYAGGKEENPTYKMVLSGETGHAETVQIYFNPLEISYDQLLEIYYASQNPTQKNGQGPDRGQQYRSIIFYHNDYQKEKAEKYHKQLGNSGKYDKPLTVKIEPYSKFYMAEDYHQDYEKRNPNDPYIKSISQKRIDQFEENFPELVKE